MELPHFNLPQPYSIYMFQLSNKLLFLHQFYKLPVVQLRGIGFRILPAKLPAWIFQLLLSMCALHVWLFGLHREQYLFTMLYWVSVSEFVLVDVSDGLGQYYFQQHNILLKMHLWMFKMHSFAKSMHFLCKWSLSLRLFLHQRLPTGYLSRLQQWKLPELYNALLHMPEWLFLPNLHLRLYPLLTSQWKPMHRGTKVP